MPNSSRALRPKTAAATLPATGSASTTSTMLAASANGAVTAWIQPRSFGLRRRAWVVAPVATVCTTSETV
ncbi:hypothetical protein [Isoptericola sp. b408]|uniref:hypothetical protein n=1 Tax=unclassified Isoptericola TaxID=2623355 RepID=UPI00350F1269